MGGKVRHKWNRTRKGRLFGIAFALGTVIPAGFLAVWAAFTIFNVPFQGGGSIVTAAEKLHFLRFGVSMLLFLVVFSIAFQFPGVLICRLFCSRKLVADLMLDTSMPYLGWHDGLMLRWINFLWGTPAENFRRDSGGRNA